MRIDVALLCDAANTRDGLLYILGGGVTRIRRPAYPAPMGLDLALRISGHQSESGTRHTLNVIVQDIDGRRHADVNATFATQSGSDMRPGEDITVPLPLDLRAVALPAAGEYSVEILIDDNHQASIPLLAQ